MALWIAQFGEDVAEVLVDAATPEEATERLAAFSEDAPTGLVPVPAGVLLAELLWAEPEPDEEHPANAANFVDESVALVPGEEFGEWLVDYLEQREAGGLAVDLVGGEDE